jgi:hypothetical protein
MRCILVYDANLKTSACCTQCGKAIGASYVRKVDNKFLYCDFNCYQCATEMPVLSLESCDQPVNSGIHRS